MALFGRALRAYSRGAKATTLQVERDDGLVTPLPMRHFFRGEEELSAIERLALDACRGRVLDIGAGAGIHSLILQGRGLEVRALDVSPDAVEVLRTRGVREVVRGDILGFRGGTFDTLLLLGHGIGMTGNLDGLDRFLAHAAGLLRPGGRILLDSVDVTRTDDTRHLAYQEANRRAGRYPGEIRMRFAYDGERGPDFGWLHVDGATLAGRAARAGWSCEVLVEDEASGEYLAGLTQQ